ncbi:unnamed protein product, partial [Arabidopsis halleri]
GAIGSGVDELAEEASAAQKKRVALQRQAAVTVEFGVNDVTKMRAAEANRYHRIAERKLKVNEIVMFHVFFFPCKKQAVSERESSLLKKEQELLVAEEKIASKES